MVFIWFREPNLEAFFLQCHCSTNEITKNSHGMGGVNGYKQETVSLWVKKAFMYKKHKPEKFSKHAQLLTLCMQC